MLYYYVIVDYASAYDSHLACDDDDHYCCENDLRGLLTHHFQSCLLHRRLHYRTFIFADFVAVATCLTVMLLTAAIIIEIESRGLELELVEVAK